MSLSEKENLSNQRNYGIDLLRIVSMFMVLILHINSFGGILSNVQPHTTQYAVIYLLQTISYCAVNCYAIISGYVGYSDIEKKYNYGKYVNLWLQVFTYNVGFSVISYLSKGQGGSGRRIIKAMFPVTNSTYWYFTAYTGLFFIIPIVNRLIRKNNKRSDQIMGLIIGTVFIAFPFVASFFGKDVFKYAGGYSLSWLLIMYIIGALVKKYRIEKLVKAPYSFLALLVCVVLTWLTVILFDDEHLLSYISPTIVLIALSLLMLFANLKMNSAIIRIVKWSSPAAFGVYIIHLQKYFRSYFLENRFEFIATMQFYKIPFFILSIALVFLIACLVIEKLRQYLFEIFRINKIITTVYEKITDRFLER